MAVTALVLLALARIWQRLSAVHVFPWEVNSGAIGLGLLLGAGITGSSWLLHQFWEAYRSSALIYLDLVLRPLRFRDLLWLGLLPGLSEELLFRGVMLPSVGLTSWGLGLSSLCFGLLHLSGWALWPYALWATLVGLLLGGVAIESGNLLIPVVAHITTNILSGFLWKWTLQKDL
jgi:uncharacterized protein